METGRVEISRGALLWNARVLRTLCAPASFLAVVKSNAYGHGLEHCVEALRGSVDCFGLNSFAEFLRLDAVSGEDPALIMGLGGLELEQIHDWLQSNPTKRAPQLVVSSPEALEQILSWPIIPPLHLKIDTGLTRLGASGDELQRCLQLLRARAEAPWLGVMTHFADVEDVSDQRVARRQLQRFFDQRASIVEAAGSRRLQWHAAASAAALILPEARLDMVRIGISLYGLWASAQTRLSALSVYAGAPPELRPVMRWTSRIAHLKIGRSGESVGYGCSVRLESDTRIAVIPVGYFEGYERALSNRGAWVLIRGKRARLLGRVMMNMIVADVQHIVDAQPGDEVVLIGRQGEEEISADALANLTGTINYEVVARVNQSIPRYLVD